FNVLSAEILALDPGRNLSRVRVGEFELTGPYFPGRLLGDRIWLCVRPALLAVLARNGRPGPNQVPAQLIRVIERPQTVRLEFSGGVAVELTKEEYEQQRQNRDWLIEFPPQALQAL
ncbi:MAG: hypothetical protein ACRD9L_05470, partial [Bryobacteraceae bacterium]